jgi:GT2 family glycosyltransferase
MPRVCAAVLNYNGRELLEIVLPSLAAQEYRDFETLVVDDCSTDDSLEYLRAEWPQVRVLQAGSANVGVTAALNVAAHADSNELLALLNNDIELDPRWLAELVDALDRHPAAASAAGKLIDYHRRELLDGAGDVLTRRLVAYRRGHGEADRGQYEQEEEVFAPSAGAALYRREAFAQVGGFDESFEAYFEDVDWGLRAQLAGLRCVYTPRAIAYHMGGASTGGEANPRYYALHRRNPLGVIVKDVPAGVLARTLPAILREQAGALVYSAQHGLLRIHLRALASAARLLPGWLRSRRRIQRARAVDSRRILQVLSPH